MNIKILNKTESDSALVELTSFITFWFQPCRVLPLLKTLAFCSSWILWIFGLKNQNSLILIFKKYTIKMAFILITVGFGKPLNFAFASPLYQHCVSVRTSLKSLLLYPHTPKRNLPAYHDDKKALFFIYKNKTLTGDTNNSQMRNLGKLLAQFV